MQQVRLPDVENVVWRLRTSDRIEEEEGPPMHEGRIRFGRPSARFAALGAVAALGVGVVACGSDSNSSSGGGGSSSKDKPVTIGLITKTETNPFFVKMKEGAQ